MTAKMDILMPAVNALLQASGLELNQAKTALYYAVLTWLQNTLDFIPILEFRGNSGTGKSEAMRQLSKYVADPKIIQGKTYSEIGANLNGVGTAIVEEGDFKHERIEELIRDRCTKELANRVIHIPPDQNRLPIINFGATIIHKREPFTDTAIRNRTITIKTRRKVGKYTKSDIANDATKWTAEQMKTSMPSIETSDRVSDTWKPLTMVATFLDDADWLEYEEKEIQRANSALAMGDQYEPEDVLIKAIIASSIRGFRYNIRLRDLKHILNDNFDLKWTSQKIHGMTKELGFETKFYSGYDWMVADEELLRRHAKERNIDLSPPEDEVSRFNVF